MPDPTPVNRLQKRDPHIHGLAHAAQADHTRARISPTDTVAVKQQLGKDYTHASRSSTESDSTRQKRVASNEKTLDDARTKKIPAKP